MRMFQDRSNKEGREASWQLMISPISPSFYNPNNSHAYHSAASVQISQETRILMAKLFIGIRFENKLSALSTKIGTINLGFNNQR